MLNAINSISTPEDRTKVNNTRNAYASPQNNRADEITQNGDKSAQRYIDNMLKAGSSAPPLEILRNAGVDLETLIVVTNRHISDAARFDDGWARFYPWASTAHNTALLKHLGLQPLQPKGYYEY